MPSGYTYGIIEGKITTLDQFSKVCMRAFLIHMRDENNDIEVYHVKPSKYHKDRCEEAKSRIKESDSLSDNVIISTRKNELLESRKSYKESIKSIKLSAKRLGSILKDAKKWTPPTNNHVKFKNFMIDQLQATLDQDGNTGYCDKVLANISDDLTSLNAKDIRKSIKDGADSDIEYHSRMYNKEVERCKSSNKWIDAILTD